MKKIGFKGTAAKVLQHLRGFLTSKFCFAWLFACAAAVVLLGKEVEGAIAFGMIISVILVVSDDIFATTLPFMLLCTFVVKCYDSFDAFKGYWLYAIPLAAALVFHFAVYRGKIRIGKTFWGLVAVAVAVTAGGLGTITKEEYLNAQALYYVVGLGAGMVALYLLLSTRFSKDRDYDVREYFCSVMYVVALFSVFMVAHAYITQLDAVIAGKGIEIQWSNNISTTMIIAMPFVFFRTKHRPVHLIVGTLILAATVATESRGGLVAGVFTYVICSVAGIIFDRKNRIVNLLFFGMAAIAAAVAAPEIWERITMTWYVDPVTGKKLLISPEEPRAKLFERMKEDFAANIPFGRGLGYEGNADVYEPRKFAMHWYHSAPMQILGSLGLTGAVCYCVQIVLRVWSVVTKTDPFRITVLLSFAGLWAMSLVNPGIFCPIPYEFTAMFMFLIVDMTQPARVSRAEGKEA